MEISFYSALMSVLWGSLFCIVLALLRKFKQGYLYYNIAPLSILLFGCIFRCVLPLDFPGFTQNISSTSVYASINTMLYTPVIPTGKHGEGITPLMIFFAVWASGTLILSVCFLVKYLRKIYFLGTYEEVTSGPVYEMAMLLCEKQDIKRCKIYKDVSIQVPQVCGFLYPVLLLPDKEFTETELRFILGHELAHWKGGDMWVRLITILICYIFWWNPIIYLLLYRMDITLEFRCDAAVIAAGCISDDERFNYLDTLQRAVQEKQNARRELQLFTVKSDLIRRSMSKEDLKRRTDIIGDYTPNPKKERRIAIFTAAVMAVVLIFSYRYILQPYYYVEEEEYQDGPGTVEVSPTNAYLVEEADGTFSMYIEGVFYKNVASSTAEKLIGDGFELKFKSNTEE